MNNPDESEREDEKPTIIEELFYRVGIATNSTLMLSYQFSNLVRDASNIYYFTFQGNGKHHSDKSSVNKVEFTMIDETM